ncbi:DUF3905 domain-containing protein [Litchfieldia salsa]|uniref:DUF3905 domain-containing protein n=1 Tax=Litchfieldia salsa TaxID=930152 RepID=A0A1H0S048_9BACI|nr:DUF3905 domain-containing protein [Litchfieldia salsa]SDP34939.1 Protein of unknown function [Litchfieldia salsa]
MSTNNKKEKEQKLNSPILDETQPHQINAPTFKGTGQKMQKPFVNEHGVIIGDSLYNSPESPINNWSEDVDPSIMAGDDWVHPTNDIGWNTSENRELLEQQKAPQGVPFMHPTKDVSKSTD